MNHREAEAIAKVLSHGRLDWSGLPESEHLERVVEKLEKASSLTAAWLHDAVEDGLTSFAALRAAGLNQVDENAIRLLTRKSGETYMDYIRVIARAEGEAGEIARDVKKADNADNMTRPCPDDMQGMRTEGGRYYRARRILERGY